MLSDTTRASDCQTPVVDCHHQPTKGNTVLTHEITEKFLALPELDKHYILGYVVSGDRALWEKAFAALTEYRASETV